MDSRGFSTFPPAVSTLHTFKAAIDGNIIRIRVFFLLGANNDPADRRKACKDPGQEEGKETKVRPRRDTLGEKRCRTTGQVQHQRLWLPEEHRGAGKAPEERRSRRVRETE